MSSETKRRMAIHPQDKSCGILAIWIMKINEPLELEDVERTVKFLSCKVGGV